MTVSATQSQVFSNASLRICSQCPLKAEASKYREANLYETFMFYKNYIIIFLDIQCASLEPCGIFTHTSVLLLNMKLTHQQVLKSMLIKSNIQTISVRPTEPIM